MEKGVKFMQKIYNSVFNSVGTAVVSLVALSGLAVFGLIDLLGKEPVAVAVSVVAVILLVTKVINKLSR